MLPRNDPDRIQIAFDDHRLVSNAFSTPNLRYFLGVLVSDFYAADPSVHLGTASGKTIAASAGPTWMTRAAQARLCRRMEKHIKETLRLRGRTGGAAGTTTPPSAACAIWWSAARSVHLDLGRAPGGANTGDQIMTLVASALAGGDCIDDADGLRAGRTARVLGCVVKAPSTLGTFLRSFRWGHARQLDRVSRELLARAWGAGAGPGDGELTIDLDSTICETYGLGKEGARHHGYTGQRGYTGYHPLLAVAAGTGDVLMARLREGRANTARGAAHFLRETMGRVRYARSHRTTHGAGR